MLYKSLNKIFGKKIASKILKFIGNIIIKLRNLKKLFLKIFIHIPKRKKETKLRTQGVFYLIDTPLYGNLGDQLIAVSESKLLAHFFPKKKVIEITHSWLMEDLEICGLKEFFSMVKDDDIIFFNGGGNFGNRYGGSELIRRKIIGTLKNNKIIHFGQTIYYTPDETGNKEKEITSKILGDNPNFKFIARESVTKQIAQDMFNVDNILCYPDTATFLFSRFSPYEKFNRDGVFLCLRNDKEKYYSNEQTELLQKHLEDNYKVTCGDTHIGRGVAVEEREKEIRMFMDNIAHHKIMVTDKFHGVILSILSNTPCIALRSHDHKIVEGIQWYKNMDFVYYADSIEKVPELVEMALKHEHEAVPEDFIHYFEDLVSKINI